VTYLSPKSSLPIASQAVVFQVAVLVLGSYNFVYETHHTFVYFGTNLYIRYHAQLKCYI